MARLALFFAALSLAVSLGANISSYKLADARISDNRRTIRTEQQAIDLLCDRGRIMIGLIEASVSAVQLQAHDDRLNGRTQALRGDVAFVKQFKGYRGQLKAQLNSPSSPCHR